MLSLEKSHRRRPVVRINHPRILPGIIALLILVIALTTTGKQSAPVSNGSISGRVLRADSNAPIPGAMITVIPNAQLDPNHTIRFLGARTGADGAYRFDSLPPQSYSVRVDAPGFVTEFHRPPVVLVEGQDVANLDVQLQPAGVIHTSGARVLRRTIAVISASTASRPATVNFWRPVGRAQWVCGPDLMYRDGDMARALGTNIRLPNEQSSLRDGGFDARRQSDGTILMKIGPKVWNAGSSTMCGGCDRTVFQILELDKNLNLITLLDLGTTLDQPGTSSQDYRISADWSPIVQFDDIPDQNGDDKWSSVTFCLESGAYSQCGKELDAKPPDPPLIRQFIGN